MKFYFKYSLILFETLFLSCGVYFPIARIDEFWLFSSEFSILSITKDLFINGEILLSIIIILFGLIMPLIKIILKVFEFDLLHKFNLHKFSMVDIFLITFIVFASKTSGFFDVHLMHGFYFLLAFVVINFIQVVYIK